MKALQVPPPQSALVLQLGTLEQPQGQKPWNFLLTTVERPASSHSGRDAADAAGAGEAKAGGTSSLQDGVSGEATGAATPATAGCGASPARAGRAASRARAKLAKRTARVKVLDISVSSFLKKGPQRTAPFLLSAADGAGWDPAVRQVRDRHRMRLP